MPRTQTVSVQNNFTKGLITEGTALNFPANAATETDNCVYQYTGSCKRREDVDLELNQVPLDITSEYTPLDTFTEYLWNSVNDSGTSSLLVQQEGNNIYFYNVSASVGTVTARAIASTINLSSYKASGSSLDPALFPVQYAQGNGALIIVSRAIEPLLVNYNPANQTFTVTVITIQVRDFIGLTNIYDDTQRPAFSSIANMAADPNGIIHYYNLLNQGWWAGTITTGAPSTTSALGQWDTARTDMPSNSDDYRFYQASTTDLFDPTIVDVSSAGQGLTTKGHFLLDIGNIDRRQAAVDTGYTMNLTGTAAQLIPIGTGTIIGNVSDTSVATSISGGTGVFTAAAQAKSFDGIYNPASSLYGRTTITNSPNTAITTNSYVGKDLGSGNAKKINSAKVYGYLINGQYCVTSIYNRGFLTSTGAVTASVQPVPVASGKGRRTAGPIRRFHRTPGRDLTWIRVPLRWDWSECQFP